MIWFVVFIVCLILLIKCSDFFVDSSLIIGKALGIPQHVIGITLVALGTSVPELASSIASIFKDSSEMVISTIVGSNTSNLFLVLGLTAIVARKLDINIKELKGVLPFLILSTIWIVIGCFDGFFGRFDAIVALVMMVGYIAYCVKSGLTDDIEGEVEEGVSIKREWIIFGLSIFGIYFSAVYLIESLQTVTINAVRKGKQSVAIGNIVGSNIFNSLMIAGIPALIQPLLVTETNMHFTIPAMVVATLLFLFFIIDSKINLVEGLILVSGYLIFIIWLFM